MGEALKEAAINAKPELDSIQGRIVALCRRGSTPKWCYKLAEQWQPNFEMFVLIGMTHHPYDAE
jgi:hypothetical protein